MTQVSRYPIAKDVESRIFEVLTDVIAKLQNSSEINDFLEDFLSPVEKIMLAKRLSIAVLLAKGYDYRQIQSILRVTPPTVAAVNVSLKYTGKGYRKVVEKILAEEKMGEFWNKVDDILSEISGLVPPKGRDWSYWRKEKEEKKRSKRKMF